MRLRCGVMLNIGWFLTNTSSTSVGGSADTRAVGPVLSTSAFVLRWGSAVSMAAGYFGVESFDGILVQLFPYGAFKRKCLRTSSVLVTWQSKERNMKHSFTLIDAGSARNYSGAPLFREETLRMRNVIKLWFRRVKSKHWNDFQNQSFLLDSYNKNSNIYDFFQKFGGTWTCASSQINTTTYSRNHWTTEAYVKNWFFYNIRTLTNKCLVICNIGKEGPSSEVKWSK